MTLSSFHLSLRTYLGIIFVILYLTACSKQPAYEEPIVTDSDVVVDISALRPDIPKFYTYRYLDKKISFFVIKTNGKALSFLDACMSCYHAKKGYAFEDGYFVCRACSVRVPMEDIEKGFGSCHPIAIGGSVKDNKYVIPLRVLQEAADKF
ncbi:MAG: DUF2318 domain-containing protein [Nitrospirae bacterium]|nr:DUF2318 domain-containing protein [Nitrospirota bacterium]